MGIIDIGRCKGRALDQTMAHFLYQHPCMSWLIMFIGLPIGILLAVMISTIVIMLPVSFLFGWV